MIPVFANPGRKSKKKKHRHGGGIARACRKHGMKGRWRKVSGRRKKIHRHAKKMFAAIHRRHKTHAKRKQGLMAQIAGIFGGGGGGGGRSLTGEYVPYHSGTRSRLKKLQRRLASVEKGKATKAAKRAGMYSYNHGRRHMSRRHRFNPPTAAAGITAGFRPSNLVAVLPLIGGAVLNGIARRWVGSKVPMLASGLPGIAAGIATAGLVGAAASYIRPGVGQGVFLGGMVETLSEPFASVVGKIPGLSGFEIDSNFTGGVLNDFADPRQIQSAVQAGEDMSQYPFPVNASQVQSMHAPMVGGGAPMRAHMMPGHHGGPQMVIPQHVAEAAAVDATMADYDISSM